MGLSYRTYVHFSCLADKACWSAANTLAGSRSEQASCPEQVVLGAPEVYRGLSSECALHPLWAQRRPTNGNWLLPTKQVASLGLWSS